MPVLKKTCFAFAAFFSFLVLVVKSMFNQQVLQSNGAPAFALAKSIGEKELLVDQHPIRCLRLVLNIVREKAKH